MRARALLLFDIDGTLLQGANAAHRDALYAAVSAVYGVENPDAYPVEPAGRTDLDIARQILEAAGVAAADVSAGFGAFARRSAEEYAERCPPDLAGHQVPGVAALLGELEARHDVLLSLVTGNLEPIARRKLGLRGLERFFPHGQGGFGSDGDLRPELVRLARARAGARREDTVLIGDTPRDVEAAAADGVRAIGVEGHRFSARDLLGAGAVATVREVAEVEAALASL